MEDKNLPNLFTLQELMDYLHVSRWTVYRMIKNGALPGIKTGYRWRFRIEDVQKYIREKLNYFGTLAKNNYLFYYEVLDKYRRDSRKYFLHDEAFHGKVGNKEGYYLYARERALKSVVYEIHKFRPADNTFVELRYKKITLQDGKLAVVVDLKAYHGLSDEEKIHWMTYKIDG